MFTIQGKPITKKNSQRIFTNRRTGRPFIKQSQAYEQYEHDAILQIPAWAKQNLAVPCKVVTVFYMPDKRKVDISNLISTTHDILVRGGVIADDCRSIVEYVLAWARTDKDNPRTEIELEVL